MFLHNIFTFIKHCVLKGLCIFLNVKWCNRKWIPTSIWKHLSHAAHLHNQKKQYFLCASFFEEYGDQMKDMHMISKNKIKSMEKLLFRIWQKEKQWTVTRKDKKHSWVEQVRTNWRTSVCQPAFGSWHTWWPIFPKPIPQNNYPTSGWFNPQSCYSVQTWQPHHPPPVLTPVLVTAEGIKSGIGRFIVMAHLYISSTQVKHWHICTVFYYHG